MWFKDKLDDNFELDNSNRPKVIFGFNGIGKTTLYKTLKQSMNDSLFIDYTEMPQALVSKSSNCDTVFEIYDSNFTLIAEDDSGLWTDEGDDESNMNAYLEHIKLKNDKYYYVKVIVNPNYGKFGDVNLEGPWRD